MLDDLPKIDQETHEIFNKIETVELLKILSINIEQCHLYRETLDIEECPVKKLFLEEKLALLTRQQHKLIHFQAYLNYLPREYEKDE